MSKSPLPLSLQVAVLGPSMDGLRIYDTPHSEMTKISELERHLEPQVLENFVILSKDSITKQNKPAQIVCPLFHPLGIPIRLEPEDTYRQIVDQQKFLDECLDEGRAVGPGVPEVLGYILTGADGKRTYIYCAVIRLPVPASHAARHAHAAELIADADGAVPAGSVVTAEYSLLVESKFVFLETFRKLLRLALIGVTSYDELVQRARNLADELAAAPHIQEGQVVILNAARIRQSPKPGRFCLPIPIPFKLTSTSPMQLPHSDLTYRTLTSRLPPEVVVALLATILRDGSVILRSASPRVLTDAQFELISLTFPFPFFAPILPVIGYNMTKFHTAAAISMCMYGIHAEIERAVPLNDEILSTCLVVDLDTGYILNRTQIFDVPGPMATPHALFRFRNLLVAPDARVSADASDADFKDWAGFTNFTSKKHSELYSTERKHSGATKEVALAKVAWHKDAHNGKSRVYPTPLPQHTVSALLIALSRYGNLYYFEKGLEPPAYLTALISAQRLYKHGRPRQRARAGAGLASPPSAAQNPQIHGTLASIEGPRDGDIKSICLGTSDESFGLNFANSFFDELPPLASITQPFRSSEATSFPRSLLANKGFASAMFPPVEQGEGSAQDIRVRWSPYPSGTLARGGSIPNLDPDKLREAFISALAELFVPLQRCLLLPERLQDVFIRNSAPSAVPFALRFMKRQLFQQYSQQLDQKNQTCFEKLAFNHHVRINDTRELLLKGADLSSFLLLKNELGEWVEVFAKLRGARIVLCDLANNPLPDGAVAIPAPAAKEKIDGRDVSGVFLRGILIVPPSMQEAAGRSTALFPRKKTDLPERFLPIPDEGADEPLFLSTRTILQLKGKKMFEDMAEPDGTFPFGFITEDRVLLLAARSAVERARWIFSLAARSEPSAPTQFFHSIFLRESFAEKDRAAAVDWDDEGSVREYVIRNALLPFTITQ